MAICGACWRLAVGGFWLCSARLNQQLQLAQQQKSEKNSWRHTKFFLQKCAKPISLLDVIQSESFTRKPRRNELLRSATAKPVRVNCPPPDYTARDGLQIADGAEPWRGPARRLANPCVARTSGAPSCAMFHSPVPRPGHATRYSANVLWRLRFSRRFPHR